jgi:hypothetical protein
MRIRHSGKLWDVRFMDYGSLDTVIAVQPVPPQSRPAGQQPIYFSEYEARFDMEFASDYRTRDGAMTIRGLRHRGREAVEAYPENLESQIGKVGWTWNSLANFWSVLTVSRISNSLLTSKSSIRLGASKTSLNAVAHVAIKSVTQMPGKSRLKFHARSAAEQRLYLLSLSKTARSTAEIALQRSGRVEEAEMKTKIMIAISAREGSIESALF